MLVREYYENLEYEILSEYAAHAKDTKGRARPMQKCDLRTDFQRDRDRIIHCKSFRRLKHKTQVFLAPKGDHYRTRLTHTLEVSQIARTISRSLRLNEDLTEAIALGHDLGHTPFGHAGERVLGEIAGGFEHNLQSLRIVEALENGTGLNLTWEVRDGIKCHKKGMRPGTLEGMVVNYSDRIAYINHDIDDAIRAGILKISDLPEVCLQGLGRDAWRAHRHDDQGYRYEQHGQRRRLDVGAGGGPDGNPARLYERQHLCRLGGKGGGKKGGERRAHAVRLFYGASGRAAGRTCRVRRSGRAEYGGGGTISPA